MERREFICVLSGIATRFWSRRCIIIPAMAAMALLPIEVSDAGGLSHIVTSSTRHGKSPKQLTSPKPPTVKVAALRPVALNPSALKPVAPLD